MFPRLELKVTSTESNSIQSVADAICTLPLNSNAKTLKEFRINESSDYDLDYNQHGLVYFVQSTSPVTVELIRQSPIEEDEILNFSEGTLHALHIKPTIEQRLDVHLTYVLRVRNTSGEMCKASIIHT